MKSIRFLTIGMLVFGATLFTSCKKEGCTDASSKNFNADAKKDDGTCKYEGQVVLWYGKATSTILQDEEAVTLTYYVDGKVVGSSATSVFWISAPECGQNGSITITKDLGEAKNKSYTYSVKDETGFEHWTGVANFTANTCLAIELK